MISFKHFFGPMKVLGSSKAARDDPASTADRGGLGVDATIRVQFEVCCRDTRLREWPPISS